MDEYTLRAADSDYGVGDEHEAARPPCPDCEATMQPLGELTTNTLYRCPECGLEQYADDLAALQTQAAATRAARQGRYGRPWF